MYQHAAIILLPNINLQLQSAMQMSAHIGFIVHYSNINADVKLVILFLVSGEGTCAFHMQLQLTGFTLQYRKSTDSVFDVLGTFCLLK